jgi:hypothetical protein
MMSLKPLKPHISAKRTKVAVRFEAPDDLSRAVDLAVWTAALLGRRVRECVTYMPGRWPGDTPECMRDWRALQ